MCIVTTAGPHLPRRTIKIRAEVTDHHYQICLETVAERSSGRIIPQFLGRGDDALGAYVIG